MAPKNMRTNPSASLDVCDMRIAGREGEVSFETEGADWWEIWTLPGPWKMKRMWLEPSKLSKSSEEEGVWVLSDEKLTPAFEHPVADNELNPEGGGRSRRARRSTGGPSARNSVEPSLAPPPKPAPSKPPQPKKTPSSEASTSRRTSMRRSQSATVVPPVSPVKVKKEVVKKEVVPSNAAAGPSTRRRSTRGEPEPKAESPVEDPEALVASSLVDEPEALVEDEAANVLAPPPVDAGPLPPPPPPVGDPSQPPSPPPNPPSPPPTFDLPSSSSLLDPPPRVPSPPSPTADAPSQSPPPPPAPPVEAPPSPAIEAAPVAPAEPEASAEIPPPPPPTVEGLPPPALDEPNPTADAEAPPPQLDLPPVGALPAPPVPATAPEEAIPEPPAAPKEESPSLVASPLLPQVKMVVDSSSSVVRELAPSFVEEAASSSVDSGLQEEVKVETVDALPEPSPVAKEEPRVAEPPRSSNPFALGPSPSSSSSKVDVGVKPKPSFESVEETVEEEKTALKEEKVQLNLEKEAELVQDAKPLTVKETNIVAPSNDPDLLPVASNPSPIPSSSITIPSTDQPELQVPASDPDPSNHDLPTPKAANPFGRLTPSSVPTSTTPSVLEIAPSLPSTAAPSPPEVHVEQTAVASPSIKEEAPVALVEGSSASASTKIEAMEVDPKPLPSSSLAATDALKPLPSFKRKGGPSATASQPKKSKPSPISSSTEERASEKQEARASPREEPKAEKKREEREEKSEIEERSTADSKGKGKEKETRGDEPTRKDIVRKPRATHPEPPTASQPASRPSVPSKKGKERAVPESEDSDDMEDIKTSPKPTSQASSKRKDPEPSSSPLTEPEDDSPVKPARTVTSELINPPPAKKAKKSFKSNRIESSEEEEESSGQGSSSSEDEKPVFEKKNSSAKSLLNLKKKVSKSSLPASSTSTPIVASPAQASSSKLVASSSSTPKLSKAPSASTTTASTTSVKASGPSQLLPKKSLLKPNDGTSTPKDRSKGGSSGTSTPSSSKPKPKAGPAKGSGWLTSLLPDDFSSQQASSSNLKLSAEAKKNKAMEEDIARRKKAYLAEVDAETAKPLDIEAQANVMQHFEKWQQTTLPRDEWLYPHCDGGGWAAAQKFKEKDARGDVPDGRIPRPRNAVEAEDLDFAWIASMEGNWGDAEKVQAYLNDPKHFPRGPGVNW